MGFFKHFFRAMEARERRLRYEYEHFHQPRLQAHGFEAPHQQRQLMWVDEKFEQARRLQAEADRQLRAAEDLIIPNV